MEGAMSVEEFRIDVPQQVLDHIHRKLVDGRIGYAPDDDERWRYGMDARYLTEIVAYWRDTYDWRAEERKLNRWPQFRSTVDGVPIHFYHIQGDADHPVPILLTHGWPGSVVEFQEVIPLLAEAGFSLVVPSLPGFGWSGRPPRPIGPMKVAEMWRTLMVDVLGYDRFFAQGGDFGSAVTVQLGINHADVVAAIHLNFFMAPTPGPDADPELLQYWGAVARLMEAESGYHHEHATKPQTIGLALHDNPVGWAAWVVEKFWRWGDTKGDIESRFGKDHLITNLMSYLVNDAVMSSIWMYYGTQNETRPSGPVTVPTALAHFPGEFYPMPSRALAERQHDVVRMTQMPSGGHFAAMEEPAAFARDLIDFFGSRS
ncbi:multidrug MFS transporter [Novosphingobium endophyticum]|uniref:Multidrug MFS transporter n=2 Tax=Novosphingobium endophyticum TaxID=1955250 RepID=A0A916TTJ1_9SPHN|nr:multidrug MFS transporter [Novosphingobium endophyticum]